MNDDVITALKKEKEKEKDENQELKVIYINKIIIK